MTIFGDYPDIVNVAQLMDMLHICRYSAYKLISSGKIIGVKCAGEYKIPKQSVIDYILYGEEEYLAI